MQPRFPFATPRTLSAATLMTAAVALLSACGGGGDGDSSPATVSTMLVASTKPGQPVYGLPVIVTVTGTHLRNLSLDTPGCRNVTRLSDAPHASTDTTAYFQCTPSGAYTSTIKAVSNGATVTSQTLTVPAPIVTMAVSGNGVTGNIVFKLKGDVAPITVDNFLAYVNAGYYTGTIVHRLVDQTNVLAGPEYDVIQAGSYGAMTNGTLPDKPKAGTFAPIPFETTGGKNVQWTAAMARTSDLNSATSGFFVNVKDNSVAFDTAAAPGYAVFADVSGSAALLSQIAAIGQGGPGVCTPLAGFNDGSCVPIPNVTITSATQTQ